MRSLPRPASESANYRSRINCGPHRLTMSRSRIIFALAVVLLAVVAVAWCWLRTGDPTSFASGTRVELAAFKGANPTGVPTTLAGADVIARGEYLTRAADCAA